MFLNKGLLKQTLTNYMPIFTHIPALFYNGLLFKLYQAPREEA